MTRRGCRVQLRGATAVEFLLSLAILLPFTAALFELTQLGVSRQLLHAVAFDGVRAAATRGGDLDLLRHVLARGLVPLLDTDPQRTAAAYAAASVEVGRPDITRLIVHAPTAADFDARGLGVDGDRRIPNDALAGADANVLDVSVIYCRRFVIPIVDRLFSAALQPLADAGSEACLRQQRWPLRVRVATVMQSAASARQLGLATP